MKLFTLGLLNFNKKALSFQDIGLIGEGLERLSNRVDL